MTAEPALSNQAFAVVEAYLNSPGDDRKDSDILHLAHILLNSILKEYQHLRLGYEKDIALAAWACRNLLELDVYIQYILKSESNARRFMGHITIDGIEMFESMKEWLNHYDPEIETLALDETLRLARERRASEAIADKKFLDVRALADEVGMTVDYKYTFKMCSKLVHPTPWSVVGASDDNEREFRTLLFKSGVRFGIEGFNAVREHAASR